MKVKQLKELLKNTGDDSEILFHIQEGCCGDFTTLEIVSAESESFLNENNDIWILFKYLPGYKTCIQSGMTRKNHEEYMKRHNIKENE